MPYRVIDANDHRSFIDLELIHSWVISKQAPKLKCSVLLLHTGLCNSCIYALPFALCRSMTSSEWVSWKENFCVCNTFVGFFPFLFFASLKTHCEKTWLLCQVFHTFTGHLGGIKCAHNNTSVLKYERLRMCMTGSQTYLSHWRKGKLHKFQHEKKTWSITTW